MKKVPFFLVLLCTGCAGIITGPGAGSAQVQTQREKPYYLSTDANKVEDTCPGHDILKPYVCTAQQPDGFSCFDVYMVQGSPTEKERYTLLQQVTEVQPVTPQPQCPNNMQPTCESFLQALNYNLEFSWYLVNFPSSSFEQCRETYDCKRIDCYIPHVAEEKQKTSTLVSCVYKRNQIFFVGSQITCQQNSR